MYQIIAFPFTGGTEVRSEAASLEGLDFDTVKDRTTWVVRVRGTSARKLADVDIADQPEKASEAAAIVREELLTRHRMGIFTYDFFRVGNRFGPPRPLYTSARAGDVEIWEGNNL